MPSFFENLDSQHYQIRSNYLLHYNRGNYYKAAVLLYSFNLANGKARITDMVPFTPDRSNVLSRLRIESQAMQYCDQWYPAVEAAATLIRDENLAKLVKRL